MAEDDDDDDDVCVENRRRDGKAMDGGRRGSEKERERENGVSSFLG